jgi:hypothetical protein
MTKYPDKIKFEDVLYKHLSLQLFTI